MNGFILKIQFSSVQLLSRVRLFATPWITACQAFLSITNSRSSLRLTSIESVMPSSHLIRCRPLLLLPPIPPSIRVFSNESTLRMRWRQCQFRFNSFLIHHCFLHPILTPSLWVQFSSNWRTSFSSSFSKRCVWKCIYSCSWMIISWGI